MANNIQNMLCLSTVHIKPETLENLQEGNYVHLTSYRKEHPADSEEVYGAFVYVPSVCLEEGSEELEDIPEDLRIVLNYADSFNCQWLMFDCDEEEIGELPAYRSEWDEECFGNPPAPEVEEENTLVHYMYRDASNYKLAISVVIRGRLPEADMIAFNEEHGEDYFYPAKLGLDASNFVSAGYAAYDDDPDFHEFCYLEYSTSPANAELTVEEFVKKFPEVKAPML